MQVPLKADLKSLCLTSRILCALALPYLFETVWIKVRDERAPDTFFRSVGCGAGRHFYKTKALVLVKGFQTDFFGTKSVVAVPIARNMLRKMEPCSDILDYDPECDWIGGQPGRLHHE
jgi:hypothetical protein